MLRIEPTLDTAKQASIGADWSASISTVLGVLLLALLLCWLSGRWRWSLAPPLILLHVLSQLFLLRPLMSSDDAATYLEEPPALAFVEPSETVVMGKSPRLLGGPTPDRFPDEGLHWLSRTWWAELQPLSGVQHGLHYELNISPEGLDSFLERAAADSMQVLGDRDRLRLLRTWGVDVILLYRPLPVTALLGSAEDDRRELARLRTAQPVFEELLHFYEVVDPVPDAVLVTAIDRVPHLGATLERLVEPSFDARRRAVLAAPSQPAAVGPDGEPGTVEWVEKGVHRLRLRTASQQAGALVLQRSYLPIYRARVNGEPVPIAVANLSRLSVELQAGEHEVEIYVDRRPFLWSLLGLPLGLLLLLYSGSKLEHNRARSPSEVRASSE